MSNLESDEIALACAAAFRELNGLANTPGARSLSDAALISRPMQELDVDSLSIMEFVMTVEDRFGVELDELAVNHCQTIGDLAALIRQARGV